MENFKDRFCPLTQELYIVKTSYWYQMHPRFVLYIILQFQLNYFIQPVTAFNLKIFLVSFLIQIKFVSLRSLIIPFPFLGVITMFIYLLRWEYVSRQSCSEFQYVDGWDGKPTLKLCSGLRLHLSNFVELTNS